MLRLILSGSSLQQCAICQEAKGSLIVVAGGRRHCFDADVSACKHLELFSSGSSEKLGPSLSSEGEVDDFARAVSRHNLVRGFWNHFRHFSCCCLWWGRRFQRPSSCIFTQQISPDYHILRSYPYLPTTPEVPIISSSDYSRGLIGGYFVKPQQISWTRIFHLKYVGIIYWLINSAPLILR